MLKLRHFQALLERLIDEDFAEFLKNSGEALLRVVEFFVIDMPEAVVYDRDGQMRPIFAQAIDARRKRRHDPGWPK